METDDSRHEPATSRRDSASERAYRDLRTQILRGDLPVGTVLTEAELASSLGVSRTPLRQALRLLLEDGLVEGGPRRQLAVTRISDERRHEVFFLLIVLEREAIVQACRVMPIDEIDYLRLILIRQRRAAEAGDAQQFIDLDDEFHLGIAAGARWPLLAKFLGQIRGLVRMIGVESAARVGRMSELVAEHQAIVDALEARDEAAAAQAIDRHLSGVEEAHAATVSAKG